MCVCAGVDCCSTCKLLSTSGFNWPHRKNWEPLWLFPIPHSCMYWLESFERRQIKKSQRRWGGKKRTSRNQVERSSEVVWTATRKSLEWLMVYFIFTQRSLVRRASFVWLNSLSLECASRSRGSRSLASYDLHTLRHGALHIHQNLSFNDDADATARYFLVLVFRFEKPIET